MPTVIRAPSSPIGSFQSSATSWPVQSLEVAGVRLVPEAGAVVHGPGGGQVLAPGLEPDAGHVLGRGVPILIAFDAKFSIGHVPPCAAQSDLAPIRFEVCTVPGRDA